MNVGSMEKCVKKIIGSGDGTVVCVKGVVIERKIRWDGVGGFL